MSDKNSEDEMIKHETHIVTYKNEQYAYCTCDWIDIWRPDDGTAYESAGAHKQLHGEMANDTTERVYTRKDLARAWEEGNAARGADIIYTSLSGDPSYTPNPYEQEEK